MGVSEDKEEDISLWVQCSSRNERDVQSACVFQLGAPQQQKIKEKVQKRFPKLCCGIGKLEDCEVHIHIDESVSPVAQHHYRVPFHLREAVEKEQKRLLELDVIESRWSHTLVVTDPTCTKTQE